MLHWITMFFNLLNEWGWVLEVAALSFSYSSFLPNFLSFCLFFHLSISHPPSLSPTPHLPVFLSIILFSFISSVSCPLPSFSKSSFLLLLPHSIFLSIISSCSISSPLCLSSRLSFSNFSSPRFSLDHLALFHLLSVSHPSPTLSDTHTPTQWDVYDIFNVEV